MKEESLNFVEKYRPDSFSGIIGQEEAIKSIRVFLDEFPKKKAMLLHGPAGTGKTSMVLAAAKEKDCEILELNSSDFRNRAKLESILKPATLQQSLFKKGKILLMDEVDGVTGTDIGGIPELVRIISETKYPIIMTCNDAWQSKMAPVRAKSKVVEIKQISIGDIVSILSRISEAESLDRAPLFLKQIAIKSQGDLRAAINDLQSYASGEVSVVDSSEKRDVEQNIFVILRRLFKERAPFLDILDTTSISLDEILLWLEENIPKEYKNEVLAKAYYALGNADVFRGRIYRKQSWRFLVYQNIFQSAGISLAKDEPLTGFTKYERPKRILRIWINNQKIEKKKTISKKFASYVHCSTKRAMRDFEILKYILRREEVQKKLRMSVEEIEYVREK